MKRSTARASLQRTTERQILTPEDMFQFCEENLSKKIKFFYVTTADLKEAEKKLDQRFKESRAIPGTLKYQICSPGQGRADGVSHPKWHWRKEKNKERSHF